MFEPSGKTISEIRARFWGKDLSEENEAGTRLKVIDRILFEALGWSRDEVGVEQPVPTDPPTFLDYALRSDGASRVVVEAKRSGTTFLLPAEKKARKYVVSSLITFCGKALRDVIDQARGYALDKGIPFAVATNGHQWIIFPCFIPGEDWTKGTAIVFRSLEDLVDNWAEFHGLLSPGNVEGGALDASLRSAELRKPKFAKRYNDTRGADSGIGLNLLAKPFSALFKLAFDTIVEESDEDLLRQCYVSTEGNRSYEREFASLLARGTPHALADQASPVVDAGAPNTEFVSAVAHADNPSVIILVGNIGAGKTTFLHHFLRVHVPEEAKVKLHWFVMDLRDEPAANDVNPDLAVAERRIYESLLKDVETRFSDIDPYEHDVLRRIFSHEIARLYRGPRKREFAGDQAAYIKAEAALLDELAKDPQKLAIGLMQYVRQQYKHPLCVALDNVDRGSEGFQQFVYSLAHRLSRDAGCTAIVTMRQTVYEGARSQGYLDIRNDTVYLVAPPSLQSVFSRRIKYAKKLLGSGPSGALRTLKPQDIESLTGYLEVINELLLGDADDVRRCLEALCAGNIRRAFEFLQRFAASGHTNVSALIQAYNEARDQRRRAHFGFREFLRPFACGERYRYHGRDSSQPLMNLFEVSAAQQESHFLRCRVLAYLLEQYRKAPEGRGRGEVTVSSMIPNLQACGHAEPGILAACAELVSASLVERLSSQSKPLSREDVLRIGAAGSYYLTDLLVNPDYIFFMSQDTVLYDQAAHRSIEQAHRAIEGRKGNRLNVLSEFVKYLVQQESRERTERGSGLAAHTDWDRPFAQEMERNVIGAKPAPDPTQPASPRSAVSRRKSRR